jgi:hypothetical protein
MVNMGTMSCATNWVFDLPMKSMYTSEKRAPPYPSPVMINISRKLKSHASAVSKMSYTVRRMR